MSFDFLDSTLAFMIRLVVFNQHRKPTLDYVIEHGIYDLEESTILRIDWDSSGSIWPQSRIHWDSLRKDPDYLWLFQQI